MWTLHKAALFPSVKRICGVPLNPPTVGHYAILETMESPFLYGGTALSGDLIGCVVLLSMNHARASRLIRHPILFGFLQWVFAWRMRRKGLTFEGESARLSRWISECTWFPERFVEPGTPPSFPSASPHAIRLLWILTEHFTEKEVLAMSIIKAHALALARAESNGNQYETKQEYFAQGLPEGYAYHKEDYPEIATAIKAIEAAGKEYRTAAQEINDTAKRYNDSIKAKPKNEAEHTALLKAYHDAQPIFEAAQAKVNEANEQYQKACIEAGGGIHAN
jgi:hypothetical protein